MRPLDYLNKRISEVTERLNYHSVRVNIHWYEASIVNDLKEELETLNIIKRQLINKN